MLFNITLPQKHQLYWHCAYCGAPHQWPEERAKKFCNITCATAERGMRRRGEKPPTEAQLEKFNKKRPIIVGGVFFDTGVYKAACDLLRQFNK